MARSTCALLLLVLAPLLMAQEKLVESIEVEVVSVDVVVTDRAGNRVTGLTKDDFEVLEDGKRQSITNFSEIRATPPRAVRPEHPAAPASPQRPRRFLLFVDNYSLHPDVRAEVVSSLLKFVDAHLAAGDEASVVSWNRALKILTPFTSDKETLRAAIRGVDKIGSTASLAAPLARVQKACMAAVDAMRSGRMALMVAYESCILAAREQTEDSALTARQLLGAINVSLNTLDGFEGKKVLVLAGAQLPAKPGLEIYQWANALFLPYMRGGFDAPMERPDDVGKVQDLAIEAVGQSANAHGVTLYLIAAALPGDPNGVGSSSPVSDNGAEFLHRQNTASAYRTLADLTGGLSVTRNAKLDAVFDGIAEDLDSYYSLGYRPSERAGKERAIEVRARNAAYTVRARKSWTPKSADDRFADRVVANVFSPAPNADFEVKLKTEKPRKQGETFVVPIEVTFPPSLTLIPSATELSGGFTFSVAVGNALGGLSTVFRQPQTITIRKEEERGFRATPITYTATLTLRRGENLISVGILDQVGRTAGFARATVIAE